MAEKNKRKPTKKPAGDGTDDLGMMVAPLALDVIKPYEKNPKNHSPEAVEKMAKMIKAYGWKQPIVVDGDFVIVIGHRRYLAAKKLGLKAVPVHVARDLSPDQIRALRISDNRLSQDTEWDEDLLREEIGALRGLDAFDLSLTGFGADDITELFNEDRGGKSGSRTLGDNRFLLQLEFKTEKELQDAYEKWSIVDGVEATILD